MKWNVKYFDELLSTNDKALDELCHTCVVAKKQTKGRGRCGRTWVSSEGNLFFSLVLEKPKTDAHLLSFVVALSVVECLKDLNAKLKWPNDILVNGKKVAGILLEAVDDKVIAGVGINTKVVPTGDFLYPVASLNGVYENEDLLHHILERLDENLYVLKEQGFLAIREKYFNFMLGISKQIKVQLPLEEVQGTLLGIALDGAMELKLNDSSIRLIRAGDVFLMNEGIKNE